MWWEVETQLSAPCAQSGAVSNAHDFLHTAVHHSSMFLHGLESGLPLFTVGFIGFRDSFILLCESMDTLVAECRGWRRLWLFSWSRARVSLRAISTTFVLNTGSPFSWVL